MLDRIKNNEEMYGGCLLNTVDIPYNKMIKMLGEPSGVCDDYKTDVEWRIKFDDVPLYVYNYKDGVNYNGLSGIPNAYLSDWHIGGEDREKALELKEYLLENMPEGEEYPEITDVKKKEMINRIEKLDFIQFSQVDNFLYDIGA